mmetsp:Transcript_31312/g.79756  ORF Transcript_31312/g.79756 Transcript_31312/m.79756 type:complete len:203 (-) Transcript_31312:547-1155(-)
MWPCPQGNSPRARGCRPHGRTTSLHQQRGLQPPRRQPAPSTPWRSPCRRQAHPRQRSPRSRLCTRAGRGLQIRCLESCSPMTHNSPGSSPRAPHRRESGGRRASRLRRPSPPRRRPLGPRRSYRRKACHPQRPLARRHTSRTPSPWQRSRRRRQPAPPQAALRGRRGRRRRGLQRSSAGAGAVCTPTQTLLLQGCSRLRPKR